MRHGSLQTPEKGAGPPSDGVTGDCDLVTQCRFWELGSLKEQQELLISELSLYPHFTTCKLPFSTIILGNNERIKTL